MDKIWENWWKVEKGGKYGETNIDGCKVLVNIVGYEEDTLETIQEWDPVQFDDVVVEKVIASGLQAKINKLNRSKD